MAIFTRFNHHFPPFKFQVSNSAPALTTTFFGWTNPFHAPETYQTSCEGVAFQSLTSAHLHNKVRGGAGVAAFRRSCEGFFKKTTSGANIMVVSQSVGFMVDMLVCQ